MQKRADILLSDHVCVWCHFYRGVGYGIPRMGIRACPHDLCVFPISLASCAFFPSLTFCFSIRVYHPYWRDPGHYEPASWVERHHGVDHRLRPSRSPDCDDAVQDLGLYYYGAGASIHERLQARPLHEACTSPDVLLPGRRYCRCWDRAARRASVDVLQRRGPLLPRSERRLYLPIHHRVRHRIHYCKFVVWVSALVAKRLSLVVLV